MKNSQATIRVIETLAEQHPNADTELRYCNAFELLVATILSAQSTDQRVNMVTPALFARYPQAQALAEATAAELEPQIVSTGFFRQKAKALIGMAQKLVAEHGGEVPADMQKLTALPGVGRKTANVVLGHALGVPGLPVDRHVLRVSNRIGIAESDDPEVVEEQLCRRLPREMWTLASDVQILHGRRICRPTPLCDECSVRDDCDYYRHVVSRERATKDTKTAVATKGTQTGIATKRTKTTAAITGTETAGATKRTKTTAATTGTETAGTTKDTKTAVATKARRPTSPQSARRRPRP